MGKGKIIFVFLIVFMAAFFFLVGQSLYAQPGTPPPPGKVWVKADSSWILVPAPPADAPYIWVMDKRTGWQWVLQRRQYCEREDVPGS